MKHNYLICFLFLSLKFSFAQVILFQENFDTASGVSTKLSAGAFSNWSNYSISGTTNNEWWLLQVPTHCASISGNYSIGVSKNTLNVSGSMPAATITNAHEQIAYYTTPINATAYTSLTLDFKWLGMGSGASAFGKVCYSLNGTTWTDFPTSGTYNGQNTVQTVTNLSLAAVNGQSFYLGFRWKNLASSGSPLSFQVDDIVVKGIFQTYCIPNGNSTGSLGRRINKVQTFGEFTNFTNTTNALSTNRYGDFYSTHAVESFAGGNLRLEITTNNPSNNYSANIYIDWNNDNDFNDTSEKAWTNGINNFLGGTPKSATIGIPDWVIPGDYRMRIVAGGSGSDPVACPTAGFSPEEYEDYKLTVIPTPTCAPPTLLMANTTSTTSATVTWMPSTVTGVPDGYEYVISTSNTIPVGSGTATSVSLASFTGLINGSTYYVFIRSNCGGTFSAWTSTSFTLVSTYCAAGSTDTTHIIENFTTTGGITNINNTTSAPGVNCYSDYTAQAVSQYAGSSFNFSTVLNDPFPNSLYKRIFIDWDNDRVFDAGTELVFDSIDYDTPGSGIIAIPSSIAPGNYRMRVMSFQVLPRFEPCGISSSKGEVEDYTITVLAPPTCSDNPTGITFNQTTSTGGVLSWEAPVNPPVNGYDYYYSTTISPAFGTAASGSVAAGVTSANISGLTPDTTYYFWVRSKCATNGAWMGPVMVVTTSCAPNSGTGSTTLGCPSNVAGGLGLNGLDPAAIGCGLSSSTTLEANFSIIKSTENYTVSSIPFNPPYAFNCLRNRLFINKDDLYSDIINLPFDFCFFGNSYNQCVVGANGSLTFDTTLKNTFSGWVIEDNLPSSNNYLKGNTIFGACLDIDPSKGGQVGWELINLDNGCRALVVSYYQVPNYSNLQAYTGMMVLYENTNIIDVYVKRRRTDGGHNDSNAIIGIQNAFATQAVVAPGRNSLDPDWSTDDEAWRFSPNGTSLGTITWYEGSGTAGTVVGTGNTYVASPTVPTTYTAEVTYNLCNGKVYKMTDEVFVDVKTDIIWNGSVSTNWNNVNNWTPNVLPTLSDCVLIPVTPNNPIISGTGYNGLGGNLTIETGANLTISSGANLTVTDWINVNSGADVFVNNTANLVQINNVVNTGNIKVYRDVNVKKYDYVYWSSPVASFSSSSISPGTSTNFIWKWTPTIPSNLNGYGNWARGNESMVLGKGYIVRGPDAYNNTTAQLFTSTFTGVANNGDISIPISRGTYIGANYTTASGTATQNDDNWNLLGNPYPSSIRAIDFLTTNSNIAGFIKIWTHGTLPSNTISDPFYNNYVYNYTSDDYITYNATGVSEGPGIFDGFINSCQGFFTLMLDSGASNQNVVYNNSMRSPTYANNQFFRTTTNSNVNLLPESRLWLDLIAPSSKQTRTLIGYVNEASNDSDRLYDAITDEKAPFKLYSKIQNEKMTIQGRALPFDIYDKVPLGANINQVGEYVFSIGVLEGFLADNQYNIYLEDKELDVVHNLKNAPYRFTIDNLNGGSIENRFEIKYVDQTLGNNDLILDNSVQIITNEVITILSSNEIKTVNVWNVLGQKLYENKNIGDRELTISKLYQNNAPLIIEVELQNGTLVKKKIIY